ncbi:hypothetical protein G2W53_009704 [Senna tora]|uniref:Uncharacterized protein n=1 Tax=Senna tora TaxID=362788 RepID=A0A834WXZ3_9FABA|nr:hypothetical protein G2W53_009704 [Senna tora]
MGHLLLMAAPRITSPPNPTTVEALALRLGLQIAADCGIQELEDKTDSTGVASSRARTPGSSLPSNNSKLAPPPVDMWLMTLATPTFSTAATESPPPIIVVTPFPLRSASFLATA